MAISVTVILMHHISLKKESQNIWCSGHFTMLFFINFGRFKICIFMKVCGLSQKASAMKGMEMFQLGGKAVVTVMFLATGSHHLSNYQQLLLKKILIIV